MGLIELMELPREVEKFVHNDKNFNIEKFLKKLSEEREQDLTGPMDGIVAIKGLIMQNDLSVEFEKLIAFAFVVGATVREYGRCLTGGDEGLQEPMTKKYGSLSTMIKNFLMMGTIQNAYLLGYAQGPEFADRYGKSVDELNEFASILEDELGDSDGDDNHSEESEGD